MASIPSHDLIQTIGDCGIFQGLLILASSCIVSASAWGILVMSFGIFNPGWTCLRVEDGFVLITSDSSVNDSLVSKKIENYSDLQWNTDCAVKNTCQGTLMYNREASTVVSEWDITCERSWISSMMISLQLTGTLLASSISGHLGDRFGRKVSIYGHLAVLSIAQLAITFSDSWQMYTSLLFFIGYGAGGILACCYPFPLEFVKGWWRGIIAALPTWSISFILFSFTVWLLQDWKQIHYVSFGKSAIAFLTVFWTPESVRWLTVNGRVAKAKAVVSRIARINRQPPPNTQLIDIIAKVEIEKMGNHNYTYLDFFRIPSLRLHSIKFGIIWAIMGLIYFTILFGTKALSGNFYLNLALSAFMEIPIVFFISPAVNIIGRRKSALIFFFAEIIGCFVLAATCLMTSADNVAILVLALLCKLVAVGIWAIFYVYSAEVFPTVVRSMLFGYLNTLARVGSIISPFLIPNDPSKIYIIFLIMGSLCIAACGLIWSLPETKGMAMRDTTQPVVKEDIQCETPLTLGDDKESERTMDSNLVQC